MRMGVVDIGSNTSRLLVAEVKGNSIETIEKGRVRLALGEEIERTGNISETSITEAA